MSSILMKTYPKYSYYRKQKRKKSNTREYMPFFITVIFMVLAYHFADQIITWMVVLSGWIDQI